MDTTFSFKHVLVFIFGLAFALTGCSGSGDDPVKPTPTPTPTPGTDVAVTSVTVNQAKGYLEKNGTLYLEATVKPDNATNKTVTWASSNSAVATVSSTGQVTAKAAGTAQITATAGGKTANCAITVFESATDLSLVDIYGKTITRSTANCYVVSKPGFYKIPMVYGNAIKNGATNKIAYVPTISGEHLLSNFLDHKGAGINTGNDTKDPWVSQKYPITKAGLIWMDSQNLVEGIGMTGLSGTKENKYLTFYLDKANFTQGNAIVAAYDSDGLVAWSWHIWVTDADLTPVQVNILNLPTADPLNLLPVFLGWCEPKSEKSKNGDTYGNCVYYQWGRKDPMLGSKGSGGNVNKAYYGPKGFNDGSFKTANLKDDISSYIQNPGAFNTSNVSVKYSNLWCANANPYTFLQANLCKTVYDPSPVGFCVSPPMSCRIFTKNGQWTNDLENINSTGTFKNGEGYYFYTEGWKTGKLIHFPALGARKDTDGSVYDADQGCWLWFSTCYTDLSPYRMVYYKQPGGVDTVGPMMTGTKGRAGQVVISCQEQ